MKQNRNCDNVKLDYSSPEMELLGIDPQEIIAESFGEIPGTWSNY